MKKIQLISFVLLAVLIVVCGHTPEELEYSPSQAVISSSPPGPSEEPQTPTLVDFDVSVEWVNILLAEYINEQRNWFQERHGPVLNDTVITLSQPVIQTEIEVRSAEIIRMESDTLGIVESLTKNWCEGDELFSTFHNCSDYPEEPQPIMDRRGDFYLSMDNFHGLITYWIVFYEDDQWWLIEIEGDWNDEYGFNPESSFSLPIPD